MAGKDSQSSSTSLNSDLDHTNVENCFHEFYTEVCIIDSWNKEAIQLDLNVSLFWNVSTNFEHHF